MKKQALWMIWWEDIVGDAGWAPPPKEALLCMSVGFLVERPNDKQKRRCWRMADTISSLGCSGTTTIPEGCVVKTKRLTQVDPGFAAPTDK